MCALVESKAARPKSAVGSDGPGNRKREFPLFPLRAAAASSTVTAFGLSTAAPPDAAAAEQTYRLDGLSVAARKAEQTKNARRGVTTPGGATSISLIPFNSVHNFGNLL